MSGQIDDLQESIDGVADPLAMVVPGTVSAFSTPSLYQQSSPWNNRGGDNYPYWQDWSQHAILRFQARMVVQSLSMSQAIAANLRSYTIGPGFAYSFDSRNPRDARMDQLASFLKRDIDDYFELNGWEQGAFETLLHDAAREDGEAFVAHYYANGRVHSRIIAPEYISEPYGMTRQLEEILGTDGFPNCWKYGVHVREGDRSNPIGYFAQWGQSCNSAADYTYFPAQKPFPGHKMAIGVMHHIKCNVRPAVKRGLSDYYQCGKDLVEDAKLIRNMRHGAAQQAAITWIEQFESVDSNKIRAHVRGQADKEVIVQKDRVVSDRATVGSSRTTYAQKTLQAGTVLAIGSDKSYLPGPMGAERNTGFEIVAALSARRIGLRWCMPEYMISADAGNANYASTLVAESPFVKARQRDQRFFAGHFREIVWKAIQLRLAYEPNRYAAFGIKNFADLKRAVYLHVQPPEVATRDALEMAQANEIMHAAGALSAETWMSQAGLDPEVEADNGASPAETPDTASQPATADQQPVAESRQRKLWEGYP